MTAEKLRSPMQTAMEQFLAIDWALPPYTSVGVIDTITEALLVCDHAKKTEILESIMPWLYNHDRLASMYISRYSTTIHVKDFQVQIAEAIEAAAAGLFHAAICSMIPVLEGILQKISVERNGSPKRRKWILPEIDALIEQEETSPNRYEERIIMLHSLRAICETRLFVDTESDQGITRLNRNGILHGLFHDYANQLNFYRLVSILDSLCFAIGLKHGGSGFAASKTAESCQYLEYLRSISATAALRPSFIESEKILVGSNPLKLRFMIFEARK